MFEKLNQQFAFVCVWAFVLVGYFGWLFWLAILYGCLFSMAVMAVKVMI